MATLPQTKKEIEQVLSAANSRPRHRFGQNFMVEPELVKRIADAGEVEPGDAVIEVGPGTGTLTEELLERVDSQQGGRVIAVEIDRDLARALRGRFLDVGSETEPATAVATSGKFQLIEGDALAGKHAVNAELAGAIAEAPGPVKLVANLPYNIASPLVIELLIAGVELLAFTVQKEVADRFNGGPERPGDYGPLTVMAQTLAEVEVLRTIPPTAFWPRPKIDSALVRLRRRGEVPVEDVRGFGTFVTSLFGQRRKTVRNPLATLVERERVPALLDIVGLTGGERAQELPVDTILALYRAAQTK